MSNEANSNPDVLVRLSELDSETLQNALEAEPQEPTDAFKRAVQKRGELEA